MVHIMWASLLMATDLQQPLETTCCIVLRPICAGWAHQTEPVPYADRESAHQFLQREQTPQISALVPFYASDVFSRLVNY